MGRRDDEQLKGFSFDMDEEIDDRNERRGGRRAPATHAHRPMDTSHAIILAAIIIVGGLWGGKLLYDYIQEQRMKAALNEVGRIMSETFRESSQSMRQSRIEMQERTAAQARARAQQQAQNQAKREAELARLQKEKRYQSAECRFWWQQHNQNPTVRTASKKTVACGL